MPDKDGIEIYKRFYPWPDRFRLGDPVLVKEITGMRWPDFAAALDEIQEDEVPDQVVLLGLMAVAFWQGNPQMTREKVRRAMEKVPMEEVEIIESDEGDADPPAVSEVVDGVMPFPTSSESDASQVAAAGTETLQDSTSDEKSPNGSGPTGSVLLPPESLQA